MLIKKWKPKHCYSQLYCSWLPDKSKNNTMCSVEWSHTVIGRGSWGQSCFKTLEKWARLVSVVPGGRLRSNGHEQKYNKLNIRKENSTVRLDKQWNRLPSNFRNSSILQDIHTNWTDLNSLFSLTLFWASRWTWGSPDCPTIGALRHCEQKIYGWYQGVSTTEKDAMLYLSTVIKSGSKVHEHTIMSGSFLGLTSFSLMVHFWHFQ